MEKIPTKAQLKEQARKLAKEHNIKPTHAHEIMARYWGFNSYNHFLSKKKIGEN